MTSIKKAKVFSTIIVLCLIAIMIPIAINAAQNSTAGIKNKVSFSVEAIEGSFGYSVVGNVKSSDDLGIYNNENNTIRPEGCLVFNGVKDGNKIVLKDSDGDLIPDKQTISINTKGFHFDKTNSVKQNDATTSNYGISMYFIFLNTATEEGTDNRKVNLKVIDTQPLPHSQLSREWTYITGNNNSSNIETINFSLNSTWNQIDEDSVVQVNATNPNGSYNYAILQYKLQFTMLAENEYQSVGTGNNLSINFSIDITSDAVEEDATE